MRIFLAPMEGVVDHHIRSIYANIGGIDGCVTEFIRVTQSRLPEKVFKRLCPELHNPLSIPVRVQLLGSLPENMSYHAAKAARMGAPAIDINFGCPAKTVNRNRGGACLLDEPDLIFQIVKAVRSEVPADTPVTAKIRLGYGARDRYLENAQAIESAGANELFVHARSKVDGYAPPAYWSCIGEIKNVLKIPVIANGEIWNLDDYRKCVSESGCKDVMLGRGLLAKPDLALQIKAYENNQDFSPLGWPSVLNILADFHHATVRFYPHKHCGNRLKQWLMYLKREYSEAHTLFEALKRTRDPQVIEHALKS